MLLFGPDFFSGGVSVPASAGVPLPKATQHTPAATPDPAFGKPFSELPAEAQRAVLEELPSAAGGLALSPNESDADTGGGSDR